MTSSPRLLLTHTFLPLLSYCSSSELNVLRRLRPSGNPSRRPMLLRTSFGSAGPDSKRLSPLLFLDSQRPFLAQSLTCNFLPSKSRRPALPKAREVYKAALGHAQSLDWPEAVCEAYLSFEEMYGSLEESESAKERARKTMDGVNFKRHKVSLHCSSSFLLARHDATKRS